MDEAIFIANMAYPSLKAAERLIREIHEEIRSIAGTKYRILYRSATCMAIGFVSELDDATVRARFKNLSPEEDAAWFFLLTRVDAVIQGWLPGGTIDWFQIGPARRVQRSR